MTASAFRLPLLGQAVLDVPMSDTMKVLGGLIGVMVLIITALSCVLLIKKVFGRKPSVTKELEQNAASLRKEMYHGLGSAKKEMLGKLSEQGQRITELEELYKEMQLDRERKWNELKQEYHQLDNKLAVMHGRMEFLIKKLEN